MRKLPFFVFSILIIVGVVFYIIANQELSNDELTIKTKHTAEKILKKYIEQARQVKNRNPANQPEDKVSAIVNNGEVVDLTGLKLPISDATQVSALELEPLINYIKAQRQSLGLPRSDDFHLQVKSIGVVGSNIFIGLQQYSKIRLGSETSIIEIQGATVVAKVKNGILTELYSKLQSPPKLRETLVRSGLKFEFTDREFRKFFGIFKTSPESREKLKSFLKKIVRKPKGNFNFKPFLNHQVSEQKRMFNEYFVHLGKVATIRIFIELVRNQQLKLVHYGSQWMFQVDHFFDFPIQFDIQASSDSQSPAVIKNLRHGFTKFVNIRGFQNPQFPSGRSQEGGEVADMAVKKMRQIIKYFDENFGWSSFTGQGSDEEIFIFTQLRSIDFKENAAWMMKIKKFVVGDGGQNLYRLNESPSVLGHEFAHAIIQHSSELVYSGESGGINEHFADIQGASVQAELSGKFDFTVGRDTLTPTVREEKSKFLKLIFKKLEYDSEEISEFNLDRVGIRHLYAPALSYATQYDHVDTMRLHYGPDCNPSLENDNCGVHSISGVLNKAASLIIAILGLEQTKTLFFNTVVYRLNQASNFEDYLVQLYKECEDTPSLSDQCDIILASFAYVGIQHPQYPIDVERPSKRADTSKIPSVEHSLTPSLDFCGWVSVKRNENIQIFDDRYNVILANRNLEIKTTGDFSRLRQYKCACARGRSTQMRQDDESVTNILVDVEEIFDRGEACSEDGRIKDKRPIPDPSEKDELITGQNTFCGWVSVNSRSRNIHIIDNRFDVAILDSGYKTLTQGDVSEAYRHQCGCVIGEVKQTQNSLGTIFNFFSQVKKIIPRSYEDCMGLEWK